ncbi:hypothetical protein F4820DRAFT_468481 [Hypoxylon rubiginosum]|uniref:Uncharacterized protein n=1 Tax=Hypoxylon rubiginosum TaxID=110542 RepID=A0ACB9Z551_9PEZI|nr:hypothetical protein F4820DRAFT_468481 [Hypoxylon rubiginosum]
MAPHASRERGRATLLQGYEIAIADNLGPGWTAADVSRWVNYHGGVFNHTMGEGVTHLLATPEQFKQKLPAVKTALAFKATHIVTKDWLEDTLEKRRRQKEREYSLREVLREENAKKKLDEKARKGIEQGETFVNTNLYHIYRDETYFSYEITITRNDEAAGNVGQKYILYIWESNPKPHLYYFVTKFYKKPRDNRPIIYRPHDSPSLLKPALDDFKGFFRKKTGIDWDERIAKQGTTPADKFQYQPPTGGKPVGLVSDIDAHTKPSELPSLSSNSSPTPAKPALPEPGLELAPVAEEQDRNEGTKLASLGNESYAGTKRGLDGEQTLPTPKKQKMSAMAAAEEASASTISNLAELVRAQRDRQGVESRKAQVIPIVLDNENDSTAESHASED